MFDYLTNLTPDQQGKVWLGFWALVVWCAVRAGLWASRTYRLPERVAVWWTNRGGVDRLVVDGTIVEQSTTPVGRHATAEVAATPGTYLPAHDEAVRRRIAALKASTVAFRAIAADAGHPVREIGPREQDLPFTRTVQDPPQSVLMAKWARHYTPTLAGAEQLPLPIEEVDGV